MCGIFCYKGTEQESNTLRYTIDRLQHRGPDNSRYERVSDDVLLAFHRLSIMGMSDKANQPMKHPEDDSLSLICNGEIYNYQALATKYAFALQSGSDCEIILFMFKAFGIERTVNELDGVFMFVLHDAKTNLLYAGRDPVGVRPGFIGQKGEELVIASEAKALVPLCDVIKPFPPATWWCSSSPDLFEPYFFYEGEQISESTEEQICQRIHELLIAAVKKRLMSQRDIGCLVSGGLDSSLVASLVARYYGAKELHTFSVGMPGSIDLHYAQQVADFLGTTHHQIELSADAFFAAIEATIYHIESYDTITVRGSVGNYLLAKYISSKTDCKVIFTGDGSDELGCGYIYLKNAPSPQELQAESQTLIREMHLLDILRSDRSLSSHGLEARPPMLDKALVKYYLSIPAELKMSDWNSRPEKYLLRKAFEKENLLPPSVLWRAKLGFSDGVSSQVNSWHKVVQGYVDELISDEEFERERLKFRHSLPLLKESYYYRKIFEQHFGGHENLIPELWVPKWTNNIDPSTREIEHYEE